MTETFDQLGGRNPTRAQRVHGCPDACPLPHMHAHTHPGGHFCTWSQYGDGCSYEPNDGKKEGD